jgi:molecular chaperone GrpE
MTARKNGSEGACAPSDAEEILEAAQEIVDAEAELIAEELDGEQAGAGEPEALDELAQAKAEADELRDRLLRLQAEWDNFRKRTAAERAEERSRASFKLVERLLPVADDIERALEHADTTDAAGFIAGIEAVQAKLSEVLEKEGVKAIDPAGQPFDANLHSAVGTVEDASLPEETVAQVYQKGYELGGRVIRPAMVVVTKS